MTKAIQEAYYLQARNPSDNSTLIELADEINLSVTTFEKDLLSDKTQRLLLEEISHTRDIFVESYPSLVLKVGDSLHNIANDYTAPKAMLSIIKTHLISK